MLTIGYSTRKPNPEFTEYLKKSSGVKKINGSFEKGDHIIIVDQNNIECGRGLVSFSSFEIEKIKGSHSREIKNILGYSGREEVVHKDDLVRV